MICDPCKRGVHCKTINCTCQHKTNVIVLDNGTVGEKKEED